MFRLILILYLLLPIAAHAGHFDTEVARLTTAGKLLSSYALDNDQDIDDLFKDTVNEDIVHDATYNAAKFKTGGSVLEIIWTAQTTGVIYIQYETRFDTNWYQIDRSGGAFLNAKFTRPRQDSLSVGEPRCFDYQISMDGIASTTDPDGIAGLPAIRVYASDLSGTGDDNPLSDGTDRQPGGVAPYFYYMQGVWIRETYEIDLDNGRIRVWMSDEDNVSTLIIADPNNSTLGFDFEPSSLFVGMDRIRLGINSSTPYPDPAVYHWHRNMIASTAPISLGPGFPSSGAVMQSAGSGSVQQGAGTGSVN